jgi:hypothetical protein
MLTPAQVVPYYLDLSDPEEIENVVGKIDPNEPDVIQAMRRSLRGLGHAYNTEKAYVQKVRSI